MYFKNVLYVYFQYVHINNDVQVTENNVKFKCTNKESPVYIYNQLFMQNKKKKKVYKFAGTQGK